MKKLAKKMSDFCTSPLMELTRPGLVSKEPMIAMPTRSSGASSPLFLRRTRGPPGGIRPSRAPRRR